MKKIINCETGNETLAEFTVKDTKQQEVDEKAWQIKEAEKTAKLEAKQAVIAKLGLTAEEAAALFS